MAVAPIAQTQLGSGDAHSGASASAPGGQLFDPLIEAEALDFVGSPAAHSESAFVWDMATDRMAWESNAASILGVDSDADIATGQAFQSRIAIEHLSRRVELLTAALDSDPGRGLSYRIDYNFHPKAGRGHAAIHLEEQGRFWPAANGKAARARGVVRRMAAVSSTNEFAGQRAEQDELTGQLTRIRLTEAIDAVIRSASISNQSCAVMMVSVNNLAVINETFGFQYGDEVLAAVGRRIRAKMRAGDVIGRYASNKFGVIMQDCGAGAMRVAAERFMKVVRETPIKAGKSQISVTVSIGGVLVPSQAATVDDTVNFAMRALDRAKGKRFDCFIPHEANVSNDHSRSRNRSIADEVMCAIDDGRMRLALQPLINAKTGRADIYECLLRMEKLDGSIVSAGEFIQIAEQLGLARLVDRRVLELSIDLLKQHPELTLSINVSSLTCSDHEWLVALQRLTKSDPAMLSRMVIEITETSAIADLDQSINFVDTLKELGCRVAIDDFGAGYTSFKNLKLLNVDIVKIDGAFVKNLADDTSDQIFMRTMIELARQFEIETVAEWVGDARVADYLKAAGITYLQGFYYGLPIDAADYAAAT